MKSLKRMMAAVLFLSAVLLCACGAQTAEEEASADAHLESGELTITGSMELSYAEQFTVDYCADGCTLITIGGTDEYLVVPEGAEVPSYAAEMTVIQQPLSDVYLASSAVMDLVVELGALDQIGFTSTSQDSWSVEEAAEAIAEGTLTYIGKYSAPDYETLLEAGCTLAVENTMIYHQPEVQEQLENLGICVLVDKSSYETHPLGRTEWIRLYGVLLGCDEEAEALFALKEELFESVLSQVQAREDEESPVAAYFYMTAAGAANIRKPGDYITKLIEYAGGTYAFTAEELGLDESGNAQSTMNLQFEAFYEKAKDADVLIYNSSISGALYTLDELIDLNSLFAEFAAVESGNVWCTEKDMFQQTGAAADILSEFYAIFTGTAEDEMQFFHRLQ